MKRFSLLFSLVVVVVFAMGARADLITIGVQEGLSPIVQQPTISFGGSTYDIGGGFGTFNTIGVTVTGTPPLTEPQFDSNTIDVSAAAAGTLNIYVTEQNVTSPLGIQSFVSSFTSQTFNGDITQVVEQTFVSTANAQWVGTPLASKTFFGLGTALSTNATPSLSNPYSITEEFSITATGVGDSNDTIDIYSAAVPEPTTLTLLGSGLLGLAAFARKKFLKG